MSGTIKPYVYKGTHKETGRFYIGYRERNKVPPIEDLGIKYFTSSKTVKPIFNEFIWEIIEEFDDPIEAYDYEQKLISKNERIVQVIHKGYTRCP